MQFLTVHHSLNQVYNVEKQVIEQVVQKAINETKYIKLKKVEVEIGASANSISLKIYTSIKKEIKFEDVITKLYSKIEQNIENIVSTKAKNIRITVSEQY